MIQKFPGFLVNEEIYHAAEQHWHEAFEALVCRPSVNGWKRWGKANFHLRSEDGDNIYAAKNDELKRGITIVQCLRVTNAKDIVAWTGKYGEGWEGLDAIEYIKISLVHTEDSEKTALVLLERFVCGGASLKEMDELITQLGVG